MNICYFTSKSGIGHRLEQSWDHQHNLVEFNNDLETLSSFDAVCLVEPYECLATLDNAKKAGPYISIYHIWKRYLAEEAPQVKLLILRYTDDEHPNVVPILSIHASFDWAAKIKKTLPCKEEWKAFPQEPLPSAEQKLQLFFKGHNNFGFVDVVARVRQHLNHIYHELSKQGDDAFPELWESQVIPNLEDMRLLFYRWRNYQPYFKLMPFWSILIDLDIDNFLNALLNICNTVLSKDHGQIKDSREKFMELNAYERLDKIQHQLNYFNKKYITPEMLGDVLIIEDDPAFQQKLKKAFPVYRFSSAYNVAEGIEKINKHPSKYKFVILDLKFREEGPEDEGLTVLEWIKNHQPQLTVLIISTTNSAHLQKKTIEMGASFFLNKSEFHIGTWGSLFLRTVVEVEKNETQRIYTPSNRPKHQGHILLVDDDKDWTVKLQEYYSLDFHFTIANTAQQARDLIREKKDYDLILADIILDDHTGDVEEGIKLIKFFYMVTPSVPVIAISRLSKEELITRALDAGVRDFLRKDHFNQMIWRKRIANYITICKTCKEEFKQPTYNPSTSQ